ncbi:MAG: hypothetical protein SCK70_09340 [bacterium]|nr:hypothetical protein [bacterium]
MYQKIPIIILSFLAILNLYCTENKGPTKINEPDPHQFIKGRVLLENQTNHAHCPVVLDSLNIGTLTDSSGYYEIFLSDSLAEVNGTFKVYIYLYDYDLDSLAIRIEDGKVIWGEEDVDDNGNLKTITLKQLLSITATTDKGNYVVNEAINILSTFINASKRIVYLSTGTMFVYFYDINTKETDFLNTDITYDQPRINPGDTLTRGAETERNKISEGYFITIHSVIREYRIPQCLISYFFELENQYSDVLYLGGPFILFLNDSKNLNYPLIEVTEN